MLMLSERAAALIDADGLRRLAAPLTDMGRDARAAHRPFGVDRAKEWAEDRGTCMALASLDQPALASIRREIRRAERLGESEALARVGAAEVADLFRVKALVFVSHRVATLLVEHGVHRPCERLPIPRAAMTELLRALNPELELRARFVLADGFDVAMATARQHAREKQEEADRARSDFEESIEDRYGAQLRTGRLRTETHTAAMTEDPDLRRIGTEGAEQIFEPVFPAEVDNLTLESVAAEAEALAHERRVLDELNSRIAPQADSLGDLETWLGCVDFALARVKLAETLGCWPEHGEALTVRDGWVPNVRVSVEAADGTYQPQTLDALTGTTTLTGPNMGGKTVALKLAGTVQYLAQMGYPVPASSSEFTWVTRIDYVGAELSDVDAGLSSFAGEMNALAEVLRSEERQLVLVDELGRSTSPDEGAALADAAVHELGERDVIAIVVTHFPSLGARSSVRALRVVGLANSDTESLRRLAAARGWQAALNSVMDFALTEDLGTGTASDALRIAELLGVPKSMVDRAARTLGRPEES